MPAFVRIQLQPGVAPPPPPPGPPPPWMALRPAGIRAMVAAFGDHHLDREALRRFDRPVYFALGGLSNEDQFREEAERLLPQIRGVALVPVSGLTGEGIDRLAQAIVAAYEVWNRRLPTPLRVAPRVVCGMPRACSINAWPFAGTR